MTPERWAQVEHVYHAALECDNNTRAAFVAEACAGDDALRREVESLLAQASGAAEFMSTPAAARAGELLGDGASLIGRTLGPYAIQARLGAGGMGEVYRARDTKLGRDVAMKILPKVFTNDPDRLSRFEREARVLASLNHPHIGAIYGLESIDGTPALVLELVDGDTLAERIAKGKRLRAEGGGLAIAEVLTIGKQIAEALEAAHERGIVHRDLKPANIKITPAGVVKVLDFGLATAAAGDVASLDLSHTPTITVGGTRAGAILGTAAYMSPEQARGQVLDQRTDIWAFGCVLYEMLTGRLAFDGETASDSLAAILQREPDWTAVPAVTPAGLRRLLRRCLEKDPERRWHDIADARIEIDEAMGEPASAGATLAAARRPSRWRRVAFFSAPVLVAAVAVATTWLTTRPPVPLVTRMTIATTGQAALSVDGNDRSIAVTPDGTRIIYLGDNVKQLFVRPLDVLEPVAIAMGHFRGPFVSPDSQWVGVVDNGISLEKVPISGGPRVRLAALDGTSRGATWLPDGTIVFATSNAATGLQRVSEGGGPPTVMTRPDHTRGEADHLWPEVLPGGRAVLFTITAQTGGLDAAQIAVLDLRTNASTVLAHGGSHAHYVASGHLVYTAGGLLRAVPFDLDRLAVRGPMVPVVPRVAVTSLGAGNFGVAANGMLVYVEVPGRIVGGARTLTWLDRTGREDPIAVPPRAYDTPRVSPDGAHVALCIDDDIFVWDLRRPTLTPVTFDPASDCFPIWSPDSRRIVFASMREGGVRNLWWQAADGTGTAERLTTSPNSQVATSFSGDGQLVFAELTSPNMHRDLFQLRLDDTRQITGLLQTPFEERSGVVSPDGHWLAYEAVKSEQPEVYISPFPHTASGQRQVSTAGGRWPVWAHNGKELFFVNTDGRLMRVPVESTATALNLGAPTKLLEPRMYTRGDLARSYDVSPDDQRFLLVKSLDGDSTVLPPSIVVVQHFDQDLKARVPVAK